MDNGEGCPVEHVFYGGEIINCEKCSKVEHSKDEIGQREGVQCPTDHIRYFCDSCSSSTLSEENMERCSSTPPSHTLSSPVPHSDESNNIECPNEHIRHGGEIINCSSCCNLPLNYHEISKVVKGRRASSTPPSSSYLTNANNSKSLVQRRTPPTPPPSPTYKPRTGGLSWTYQRERRIDL